MQILRRFALLLSAPAASIISLVVLSSPVSVTVVHAADRDTSGVIEEVIVTSRRRAESVQDVPLSVTAFGEERIDQIKPKTLRDFDGLAPNVYVGMNTAGPGASALYIRGIGYADIEKTQSPQVGVIVDGIQLGSSTGQLIDAFDIESIEVNRGPQGVLFGKNTIGGNIVVNRVKPQFNEFGVKGSVEVGNFNSRIYKARVNVPLIDDTLAIKIGATERSRQGYYRNATLGGDQGEVDFSAQTLSARWNPNEAWDIILTYDRIDDESEIPPQDPRYDGSNAFVNRADKREPTEYDVSQVGLVIDYDISDTMTLHSITGLNDADDSVNQDFDGGPIGGTASPFAQLHTLREQEYSVFSQEFRLDIDINENVDLMVGAYYFDSELDFQQTTNNVLQIPFGLPAGVPCAALSPVVGSTLRDNPTVGNALCQFQNARSIQIAGEDVESTAFFGNLNFRPWEGWEFSVGARYIDEEKDARNSYFDFSDGTFDTGGTAQEFNFAGRPQSAGVAYMVDDAWDDTIVQASARWDVNETSMLYVSYSEGFRSGGFSIRSAGADTSQAAFEPEDAFQYEIGTKNEFFDRRLLVNFSYFFIERDGSQFSSIIPLPPRSIPGTTTIINNGGTTETSGFELETTWLINENWVVSFNGGTIDVDNKRFTKPCDVIDGCANGDPSGTLRSFGGNDDSRQPEWNASLNIAYDRELADGGHIAVNLGAKKVGDFLLVNTGASATQRLFEGGYSQVDARLQYDFPISEDGRMAIALFGKNLNDSEWREQALFLGDGAQLPDGGPNTGFQGWGAPETWGLEITIDL